MHYRPLGNTGIQVSTISMGCNRLGEDDEDPHWDGLVGRAIELGVTLFDTSEQYTGGRSEEVLGRAVGDRDDVLIATKVSPNRQDEIETCNAEHVIERAHESLRRLKRSTIDVYQLHSPHLSTLQNSDWADGLDRRRMELRAVAPDAWKR